MRSRTCVLGKSICHRRHGLREGPGPTAGSKPDTAEWGDAARQNSSFMRHPLPERKVDAGGGAEHPQLIGQQHFGAQWLSARAPRWMAVISSWST